jgi:hypothetical protein
LGFVGFWRGWQYCASYLLVRHSITWPCPPPTLFTFSVIFLLGNHGFPQPEWWSSYLCLLHSWGDRCTTMPNFWLRRDPTNIFCWPDLEPWSSQSLPSK